ncbi:MAG: DUF2586 family protein [Mariprofundaceae bacterium]
MATYLTPGVYIEEISSGSKPIEGVETSVAAFIGVAERGPVSKPVSVTKPDDFAATFGSYLPPGTGSGESYLAHAVTQFFAHGGSRCYVVRVADNDAAPAEGVALGAADFLSVVEAAWQDEENPGSWANGHYDVLITPAQSDEKTLLDIVVRYWETPDTDRDGATGAETPGSVNGYSVVEAFTDLSHWPDSKAYAPTVVNDASGFIKIEINVAKQGMNKDDLHGISSDEVYVLDSGADGADVAVGDDSLFDSAFHALDVIKDVRLIAVPGIAEQATNGVAYCDNRPERDCLFFMDPPASEDTPDEIQMWSAAAGATSSSYGVLFYPWLKAANFEAKGGVDWFPPSGFVMGMCGRIDQRRGVWKAPAGLETALGGVKGVAYELIDKEQDQLNPRGINCLRVVKGTGTVIWGSRTRATRADPEWRYVPVRRTAVMIERSIYGGIQWAVFEPNSHNLWASLRNNIGSFMNGLFRAGAFQGEKASDAYFVRCGLGDTMTQGDIDRGQVIVIVGFAALKPAEFVIVRIQQKVGQE